MFPQHDSLIGAAVAKNISFRDFFFLQGGVFKSMAMWLVQLSDTLDKTSFVLAWFPRLLLSLIFGNLFC